MFRNTFKSLQVNSLELSPQKVANFEIFNSVWACRFQRRGITSSSGKLSNYRKPSFNTSLKDINKLAAVFDFPHKDVRSMRAKKDYPEKFLLWIFCFFRKKWILLINWKIQILHFPKKCTLSTYFNFCPFFACFMFAFFLSPFDHKQKFCNL